MGLPRKVFVVVPAYNEEGNLPSLLPAIHAALVPCGAAIEIIVVNDGSRDRTLEVAERLAGSLPLRVISHPTNLGVARVFTTGLRAAAESAADEDVIVLMEADSTNDPALLPEMLRCVEDGSDVVIGSRYESGGRYHRFPLKRMVLSLGANALVRWLFPIPGARDYTIFYRAYRAGILKKGFGRFGDGLIETRTFVCNAELLIKLNSVVPLRVREVPLVYRYDLKKGRSKMPVMRTLREYMAFLWRARHYLAGAGGGAKEP